MVDVALVSGDVADKETSGLGNDFCQIKLGAGFWKSTENEEERIGLKVRDQRPLRGIANIFSVNKLIANT